MSKRNTHAGQEWRTNGFRTFEESSIVRGSLASSTPLSSVVQFSSALLAIAKRCRASLPTRSPKRSPAFVRRTRSFRPSDFVIHSSF